MEETFIEEMIERAYPAAVIDSFKFATTLVLKMSFEWFLALDATPAARGPQPTPEEAT